MPFISMSRTEQQVYQMVLGLAMGEVSATSDKATLMTLSGKLAAARYPKNKKKDD